MSTNAIGAPAAFFAVGDLPGFFRAALPSLFGDAVERFAEARDRGAIDPWSMVNREVPLATVVLGADTLVRGARVLDLNKECPKARPRSIPDL